MNPSEIKTAKDFLRIAKEFEANATIDRETVVVISDYINQLEAEVERLKEYENIRPVGCPNCHRGNFSNSKFCSHCGRQLRGKKKEMGGDEK